jgi:hypothetical protein
MKSRDYMKHAPTGLATNFNKVALVSIHSWREYRKLCLHEMLKHEASCPNISVIFFGGSKNQSCELIDNLDAPRLQAKCCGLPSSLQIHEAVYVKW